MEYLSFFYRLMNWRAASVCAKGKISEWQEGDILTRFTSGGYPSDE
jgi:hypothetical protein